MIDRNNHLDVPAAAKYLGITTTAVYAAISSGKMQAFKVAGKWFMDFLEVDGYAIRKHDRRFSKFRGQLKFDASKGELTPGDVSKKLNIPVHSVYYLLRSKKLKAFRKGSCYVILMKDIEDAKKILNNNRPAVVPVSSHDRTESNGESGSVAGS